MTTFEADIARIEASIAEIRPSGPAQCDVDAVRGLLDLMANFSDNDQRARFLLSSNWMHDRGAVVKVDASVPVHDCDTEGCAEREPASSIDVADRLLAIWHAACHSTHRSPFARLGDDVHAEALAILDEHGVMPTPVQVRHLRWLCGFEVATVVSFVEMIVAGRERVTL